MSSIAVESSVRPESMRQGPGPAIIPPAPRRYKRDEVTIAYLFLLPNFLGFLVFTLLPVAASLGLAFFQWDILTPPRFVGLENFTTLLTHDPLFWPYMYNTVFLMLIIPVSMLGSLLLAVLLDQHVRGRVVFRAIYFLPSISAGVAVCLLWRWLYNTDFGPINTSIAAVGSVFGQSWQGPAWLSSTAWAKPALMLMFLWQGIGGTNMILYLAALQGVPRQLYEAADLDGAGAWHKFWHITWPMVSPTTFFIFIMSTIGGLQGGFLAAYTMTRGGPAGSTTTIEYYIYSNAYELFKMGYASAIAWFLFVLIFLVTLLNWRYGGRRVTYE